MKWLVLILLNLIAPASFYSQGKSDGSVAINSVEIYAAQRIPESGLLGFEFIEYVKESVKNGSSFVEMEVIQSSRKIEQIVGEMNAINARSLQGSKAPCSSFSFLVVLMSGESRVQYLAIGTLNKDYIVEFDGQACALRKGDLRHVLIQLKNKHIKKPLRRWIQRDDD